MWTIKTFDNSVNGIVRLSWRSLLFIPFFGSSQITGTIIDQTTKDPVYGAKVFASTGERVISDFDGIFVIQPKSYPVTLIITAKTFLADTVKITKKGDYTIKLFVDTFVTTPELSDHEMYQLSHSKKQLIACNNIMIAHTDRT